MIQIQRAALRAATAQLGLTIPALERRLEGAGTSFQRELRGWASPAWIEAQIEDPASGTTYAKGSTAKDLEGHMPAFADKITMADRRVLAAWVSKHGRATEMK